MNGCLWENHAYLLYYEATEGENWASLGGHSGVEARLGCASEVLGLGGVAVRAWPTAEPRAGGVGAHAPCWPKARAWHATCVHRAATLGTRQAKCGEDAEGPGP